MKKITIYFLFLFLIGIKGVFGQVQITGKVTSAEDGLAMPGVSVVIQGTVTGTSTDIDGEYTLEAQSTDILVFSFVGMRTQEILIGDQTIINVVLESETVGMEEIVVVGYGTQDIKRIVQNVTVIREEALENLSAVSAQELLQGQSSGVQLTQASGVLGSANVVRVRGVGSLTAGSQPLIVVDGVPMNDGADFSYTEDRGSNTGLNTLLDINPDDIESFTVLKDASATAIYGSRGANGVILIQTKKGRLNQEAVVSFDANVSWTKATDLLDMANTAQLKELRAARGDDVSGIPDDFFDWPAAVEGTGFSKNYNLSVRGGGERTKYYIGATYSEQEGFIIGNDLDRIGMRVNLENQAKDWLKVGVNLSISQNKMDRVRAENSTFAPMTTAYLQLPWVQPRDEDGNFVNTGFIANVIAIEELDVQDAIIKRMYGNFNLEVNIIEGLQAKTDFGFDRVNIEETERSVDVNSTDGYGENRIVEDNKWVTTNTLDYNTIINGEHSINVLAGLAFEESLLGRTVVEGVNFPFDGLRNVESAAEKTSTSHLRNKWALFSLFSRVGYNYQGKYLFEGSLRRDGSSRFGSNNQYGTFWSVAGGWLVSDESFMDNYEFIDRLKLTASYGVSGNDKIGYYPAFGLYQGGVLGNYNDNPGLVPEQAPNPDLAWEESKTFDIGIQAQVLDERLEVNANYFNRRIKDLILEQPIPYTTGFSTINKNVGEMKNSGFEFEINSVNIKTQDFEWTTNFNITFLENEILSLPGATEDDLGRKFIAGSARQRAIEGHSANTFFLIRFAGINPETGDAEWFTKDGEKTTTPLDEDRVIVGDAQPDFYGGMTNTMKYKDFDLSFLLNFSVGSDVMFDGFRFTDNVNGSFNVRTKALNYWKQPGDRAYAPSPDSPTFGTFRQASTLFLQSASYLRMKNLTLGYTVPKRYLDYLGALKSARIYFTATNLFTIKHDGMDGVDPEVTDDVDPLVQGETFFTAPQSKSYLVGVRVTF